MNVQIQSVKFDADKRLVEFVNAKMTKLDRFAERSTGAEVILKLVDEAIDALKRQLEKFKAKTEK